MDFLKQWTFCVCITLIISVIFSLLTPKGKMGNFYKILISLFIFISFIFPFTEYNFKNLDLPVDFSQTELENNQQETTQVMINNQVKQVLKDNNIIGANVSSQVKIKDDEIQVKSVKIAVPDEYDLKEVENIIYDKLSMKTEVIYIGQ